MDRGRYLLEAQRRCSTVRRKADRFSIRYGGVSPAGPCVAEGGGSPGLYGKDGDPGIWNPPYKGGGVPDLSKTAPSISSKIRRRGQTPPSLILLRMGYLPIQASGSPDFFPSSACNYTSGGKRGESRGNHCNDDKLYLGGVASFLRGKGTG